MDRKCRSLRFKFVLSSLVHFVGSETADGAECVCLFRLERTTDPESCTDAWVLIVDVTTDSWLDEIDRGRRGSNWEGSGRRVVPRRDRESLSTSRAGADD